MRLQSPSSLGMREIPVEYHHYQHLSKQGFLEKESSKFWRLVLLSGTLSKRVLQDSCLDSSKENWSFALCAHHQSRHHRQFQNLSQEKENLGHLKESNPVEKQTSVDEYDED